MDFGNTNDNRQLSLKLLGGFLVAMGIIVMFGWLFKLTSLVQIVANSAPMQFNTALCFFLSGLSILLYRTINPLLIGLLISAILLIPSLTLIEYWFDLNLAIDRLFIEPFMSTKTSNPGRMAPNTALCFVLFSLFMYFYKCKFNRQFFFIMLLPCIYGVLGFISIIGYIFHVEQAYAWGALTHMAIHTAIGFVLLSIASFLLFTSAHQFTKKQLANLLDYAVFSSMLLFFFILWQVVRVNYIAILKNDAANQISVISAKLSVEIQRDVEAIIRLFTRFTSKSYSSVNALNKDIDDYFKHMSSLESLSFNEQGKLSTRFNPYSHKIEANKLCTVSTQLQRFKLTPDISEQAGYLCVKQNDAVAVINIKQIMSHLFQESSKNFIISLRHDGKQYFQNSLENTVYEQFLGKTASINIYGHDWIITVSPKKQYVDESIGSMPSLILVLGGFISLLVMFLIRYRRKLILQEKVLLSAEVVKTTILNSTLEGVMGVNHAFKVYFMNQAAQSLLDVTFDNKSNISLDELIKTTQSSMKNDLIKNVKASLDHGQLVKDHAEIIVKSNGNTLPISYSCSPIAEQGDIAGAIIVFADNTERLAFEEKLKALALYDSLTNLPNRFSIIAHLKEFISRAQRHNTYFSLCFIDIDKFKAINDNYGHHIGDKALQYVANLISRIIRGNDFFGRLSGDEFCLILDGIYLQSDIDSVLEKIYKSLQTPFTFENTSLSISLSIGVISYSDEKTPEKLLVKADKAMYRKKKLKEFN